MKIIHIEDDQHKTLKQLALDKGIKLKEVVALIIDKGLKADKKGGE